MPRYEITDNDTGKRYEISSDVPLSEDQVREHYLSLQAAPPATQPPATPSSTPSSLDKGLDYLKSFGAGVGQGALGLASGINQAAPGLLPEPFRSIARPLTSQNQQALTDAQSMLQRDVPKGGGEYWTQAAGRGIGAGLLSPTAVIPNAVAGMGGQLGEDLLTPLLGETYGPIAGQLAGGVIGGRAGDFAMRPVRTITNPTQRAVMDAAEKNYGIRYTPGQYTGSRPMQNFEAGLEALPGGGSLQGVRDANLDKLTQKTTSVMGVPGAKDLGFDTMDAAFKNATKLMNDALPDAAQIRLRTGTRTDTQTLKNSPARTFTSDWEMPNTATKATTTSTFRTLEDTLDDIYRQEMSLPPKDRSEAVLSLVDKWRGELGRPISGEGIKQLRSDYKAEARRAWGSDNTDTGSFKVGIAKGKIANAFDDAIEASLGPEQARQYKLGRQLYWTAERVMESNPESTGYNVSPKLADAVKKAGEDYYTRAPMGSSDLVDIGRTARTLQKDSDSYLGRANQMNIMRQAGFGMPGLFGGAAGWAATGGNPAGVLGGAVLGQAVLPAVASRAIMAPGVREWLSHGLPKQVGTETPLGPFGAVRSGALTFPETDPRNLFQPD